MMQNMLHSLLRLGQLLLVFLSTALLGNTVASSAPSAVLNFLMFVCAIAWITTIYGLITHFVTRLDMPVASMGLDGIATLFTFIGAVVISAKLTVVNCANLVRPIP